MVKSLTPVRSAMLLATAAAGAVLWRVGSLDFIDRNPLFHPHGYCYLWQPDLVASHVVSDVTLWQPWFWLSADAKMITAAASVSTAIALPPIVPRILGMVAAAEVSEQGQRRVSVDHLARAPDAVDRDSRMGRTSIGLDPSFMKYLFERFRQADSSPSRTQMGLGLGLALVRHLTELHGGRVSAHSDGLGHGSTFVVEMPTVAAPAGAAHLADAGGPPRLDGKRILVVDDADGVEMVTAALRDAGAMVIPSSSASEAIEHVRGGGIDLIVSDLAMPHQDGYAFIREVRAELACGIPAIALTARVRQEDRLQALESGYQLHVSKPVLPAELTLAVSRLLRPTQGPSA